jgi:DNA-binding transcriptional regulator YbjK
MAYDKNKIFEQAKEVIIKNKLFFIEDIVAFLPIAKKTYYEYFPIDSNESNELKALLETNKTTLKVSMRSKWYTSNAPALQMALMKLISTPEELKKLSMQYVESENKHELKEFTVRVIDNNPDGNNHE